MTIELTPEHQRMVERAVHSGAYHDASDVINAALDAFGEKASPSSRESERQAAMSGSKPSAKLTAFPWAASPSANCAARRVREHRARCLRHPVLVLSR